MSFLYVIKEIYNKINIKNITPKKLKLNNYCPKSLRKSLTLRVVDAGSDEGIIAELTSLEGPYYSLESYNISFTASPKHADGLFVVGAVTKNMRKALIDAYDVVPNPKVIIACGDKAIYGDDKLSGVAGGVKDILGKVDLEIPGNPSSKDIFNYLVSFLK